MSFPLQHAGGRGGNSGVPDVVNKTINGSETFLKGTILLEDAQGEVTEIGTDVTTDLYGVSMEGASSGSPDNPTDKLTVARITDDSFWLVQVWDNSAGALRTDLSGLNEGDEFGYTVQSDVYYVDDGDTSNVVFHIEEIFDDHNLVLVSFIESVIQQ